MNHDDEYTKAIVKVLSGMVEYSPEPLLPDVAYMLKKSGQEIDEEKLTAILTTEDWNSKERTEFHLALSRWDKAPSGDWTAYTEPATWERRAQLLKALGFSSAAADRINEALPPVLERDVFIQDPEWDPWYTTDRQREHSFYWRQYRKVLLDKVGPEGTASIDAATTNIVSRLADPTAESPFQAKGLVVGHVQSGKTANFTGVIAKAIDAGYRLIIVLTGTVELLRGQTQRRLDMELIGKENILGGRDENDYNAIADIDYAADLDNDWMEGKFISHGVDFSISRAIPAIRRLTGKGFDYKSLLAGLSTLDFRSGNELRYPQLPVWNDKNLYGTDVRIAVVKKNKTVLTKLVRDLRNVTARLDEIPALIIDDEADQASVNTINPTKAKTPESTKRTAINGLIAELLGELKRSQYVGYTATPFANVFISPEDSEDIFPKDFILSLTPPEAYMGGTKFHDLEPLDEEFKRDPRYSNQAAYMRSLTAQTGPDEDAEIREALAAYVLSGAIKLWREASGEKVDVRHHTMLVHESVRQADHKELANKIVRVWHQTGFTSPQGREVMKKLFENDYKRIWKARDWGNRMPAKFDDLNSHISEALNLITIERSPVVIVNGDKDSEYEQVDFDSQRVWRILIGGTKLSRGFTVEGLTISYYRRRAYQADSLMQMGRWFGYRKGYGDLVRLYIDRNAAGRGTNRFDLYEAFQAILEDEEEFREQLREFEGLDDNGDPKVRPIDVPPMVFQQLPWLKPTSPNKMYNAELQFMGEGGKLKDYPRQPDRNDGRWNRKHFQAVTHWIEKLGPIQEFGYFDSTREQKLTFNARVAIADADDVVESLSKFEWISGFNFNPVIEMMRQAISAGKLKDWAILVPYLGNPPVTREVENLEVPVLKRGRRPDRPGFSGSSFRQRGAIERIAGNTQVYGGVAAEELSSTTRGGMLLTFASDPANLEDANPAKLPDPASPEDIATLFSLALPKAAAPRGRIGFSVQKRGGGAIIERF